MTLRTFPEPLPHRMKRLPVDVRGYPVPFFVTWFRDGRPVTDGVGEPDFRVINPRKIVQCVNQNRCWICGSPMGVFKSFVVGPMCIISRTSSEPPSHLECALFAARCCPFLSSPSMVRNERGKHDVVGVPGIMLDRNPGVACVWTTLRYSAFRSGTQGGSRDGVLFNFDDPTSVTWWARSREATKEEVAASIAVGFPHIYEIAEKEGLEALRDLGQCLTRAMQYLPEK